MRQPSAQAPTVLLLILALWLWWPAHGAVPVEGFGAMVVSIADGLRTGTLERVDAAYPINTEFYALTRLGMSGAMALFPRGDLSGNQVFTIIGCLSFAVSAGATVAFARQWTKASATRILFALIILPGFAESAFFHHENLLALACFTSSMVLVGRAQTPLAASGSGVLLGLALLTRSDFVLLAPALPLILWARLGHAKNLILPLATGVIATVATVLLPLLALGVSPLDMVAVVRRSLDLWARQPILAIPLREGLLFAGTAGLVLLLFGAAETVRQASWPVRLLLVGVPLLFLAVYGSKLWQARQFLPILPFLAALVAVGAGTLWRLLPSRLGRAAGCLVLAFVWLWPSPAVFSDGPRTLTGQFWSPLLWTHWQDQVRQQLAVIDNEVEHIGPDGVILTDDWTLDRYTHLSFREHGWLPIPASSCSANIEVWSRGGETAYHARLHIPFLPDPQLAIPALLEDFASECLSTIAAPRLRLLKPIQSTTSTGLPPFLKPPAYAAISVTALEPAQLPGLISGYRDSVGGGALDMEAVEGNMAKLQAVTPLLGSE